MPQALHVDNRNLADMETYYLARIDALENALRDANKLIDDLREDVYYSERMVDWEAPRNDP